MLRVITLRRVFQQNARLKLRPRILPIQVSSSFCLGFIVYDLLANTLRKKDLLSDVHHVLETYGMAVDLEFLGSSFI